MAEFFLEEPIRQRGIHHRLNPPRDQQDPDERHQHQHRAGDALTGPSDQGPEPEGEQQQATVLTDQQQQRAEQKHPPAATIQQPPHHEKRQQGQPDQIVKVLKNWADYRTAEEVSERDPLGQRARQPVIGQTPQHQTRRSEQADLGQGKRPHAEESHQGRQQQRQSIGVLTQMQVVD